MIFWASWRSGSVLGLRSEIMVAVRRLYASISLGWSIRLCPVSPCLNAFMAERCLPSGVFGPVDFKALARLISSRISLRMFLTGFTVAAEIGDGDGHRT